MDQRRREKTQHQILRHLAAAHLEVERGEENRKQHWYSVVNPPGPAGILTELGEDHSANDDDQPDPEYARQEPGVLSSAKDEVEHSSEDDVGDCDKYWKTNPGCHMQC